MITLPTRARKYNPSVLNERHQEIVRLKSLGWSHAKIAEHLDIDKSVVTYTLNSPMGIELRNEIQGTLNDGAADIHERIKELCGPSVDYMEQVVVGNIETASPALRLRACESILDRAGQSKITKNISEGVVAHLTGDDIEAIKARSLRAAIDCGIVQEVS